MLAGASPRLQMVQEGLLTHTMDASVHPCCANGLYRTMAAHPPSKQRTVPCKPWFSVASCLRGFVSGCGELSVISPRMPPT